MFGLRRIVILSMLWLGACTVVAAEDDDDAGGGGEVPGDCGQFQFSGEPTVSYSDDVQGIFAKACVACHQTGNALAVNLAEPFDPTTGIICRESLWSEARNGALVVPGDPDSSFLIDKVEATDLATATEGAPMPWSIPPLTDQEKANLRQWITDGANDDAFYQSSVATIFGDGVSLGAAGGKCSYCHFAQGTPPDLTKPFDPTFGIVGVPSAYGGQRVAPGDADNSVVMKKVDPSLGGNVGAVMPLIYAPLTPEEITTLRTWIAEGAQNN